MLPSLLGLTASEGQDAPALFFSFTSKTIPSGVVFSNVSSQRYYYGSNGILCSANVDEPRFEYDPNTGQFLGLLYEEQRTNLFLNSNMDMSEEWEYNSATKVEIIDDDVPTGTDVSTKITRLSSLCRYGQTLAVEENTQYVFSWWGKLGTMTNIPYGIQDASNNYDTVSSGEYSSLLNGDGFTRVSVPFTTPSGCFLLEVQNIRYPSTSGNVYFFGSVLEKGSSASSYICSTDTQTTRAADQLCFDIPEGVSILRLTLGDNTTQDIEVTEGTSDYVLDPSVLNEPHIKYIKGISS